MADLSQYLNFSRVPHCKSHKLFKYRQLYDYLIACFILITVSNALILLLLKRTSYIGREKLRYREAVNNVCFFSVGSIHIIFSTLFYMNLLFRAMPEYPDVKLDFTLNSVFALIVFVYFTSSVTFLRPLFRKIFLRWSVSAFIVICLVAGLMNILKYDSSKVDSILKAVHPIYTQSYVHCETSLKGGKISKNQRLIPLYGIRDSQDSLILYADSHKRIEDFKSLKYYGERWRLREIPLLYLAEDIRMKEFITIIYHCNSNGALALPIGTDGSSCSNNYLRDMVYRDEKLYAHLTDLPIPPPLPAMDSYPAETVHVLKQSAHNQIVLNNKIVDKTVLKTYLKAIRFPNEDIVIELHLHPNALMNSYLDIVSAFRETAQEVWDKEAMRLYSRDYDSLLNIEQKRAIRRSYPFRQLDIYSDEWYE